MIILFVKVRHRPTNNTIANRVTYINIIVLNYNNDSSRFVNIFSCLHSMQIMYQGRKLCGNDRQTVLAEEIFSLKPKMKASQQQAVQ